MSTPVVSPTPAAAEPTLEQLRSEAIAASTPAAQQPPVQPTPASIPAVVTPPVQPAQPQGPPAPAAPAPPAVPQGIEKTVNADGTITVKLPTGPVFTGTLDQVVDSIAKARLETELHFKGILQQNGFDSKGRPLAPAQPPTPPAAPPAPAIDPAMQEMMDTVGDLVAKRLGFTDVDAMKTALGTQQQVTTDYRAETLAAQFMTSCQDFPNTPQAIETLEQTIAQQGWEFNLGNLEAAHALCVRRGLYQPLTPAAQSAAVGQQPANLPPTPPPMLPTGSPAAPASGINPWDQNIPIEQLRDWAARGGR